MRERLRLAIRGAVQGVGFRPFVYRLAQELALDGWVVNSPQGVFLEVEGPRDRLANFFSRVERDAPPHAVIQSTEAAWLDPMPYRGFEIRDSRHDGEVTALVLPDIATCDLCRRDVADPANRRYRYPFTNCTHCGPRFSIMESVPYDRVRTSMKGFAMCPACQREYDDPGDRRFHAQPNACPVCGPHLALWDGLGRRIEVKDAALMGAAAALRDGKIVAVKGLGGFHLMVDAGNDLALRTLRRRKQREEKPLALMYPRLEDVERVCYVSTAEARLLRSSESPITLLRRRFPTTEGVVDEVAPANPYLGIMLPYTPLHHLLMEAVNRPVVATSGNLSDEPMCIDEHEALNRLAGIADFFLVHNRPIVRHVDDSIVRMMAGREMLMRRARGYAPLPIQVAGDELPSLVAVGGHQKNTVAVTSGHNVFISQHIGDLESKPSTDAFFEVLSSLEGLYRARPGMVAADMHPDYVSTRHAESMGLPVVHVQHHFAHVVSCMAENDIEGPVLGVSWDGTGYGTDGTIWGGEFLRATRGGFTRAGCFRPFRLPGAEQAVRQPRRSALGVLHAMWGDGVRSSHVLAEAFSQVERTLLVQMLQRAVLSPVTTSAGRLFDAVAALAGLRYKVHFEGQAAMQLEHAIDEAEVGRYECSIETEGIRYAPELTWKVPDFVVDWAPMIEAILADVHLGVPTGVISGRFHNTMADVIVAAAVRAGETKVVLTGGCFQNRALTERAIASLRAAGFRPYWHQRVPPNDGGLSLGQAVACAAGRETGTGRRESAFAKAPAGQAPSLKPQASSPKPQAPSLKPQAPSPKP